MVLEEQNLKNEFLKIGSVISGIGSLIRLDLKALMTIFPVVKRPVIREIEIETEAEIELL